MAAFNSCKYFLATVAIVLLSGCNKYFLQEATVFSNRKSPTITTTGGEVKRFELSINGSYAAGRVAKYDNGNHTETVASDHKFDYKCASDPKCNDSSINNIPFTGDNISVHTPNWTADVQASVAPFMKKTDEHQFQLKLMADVQAGKINDERYFNFKWGPLFSAVKNTFAIHPKILIGYSNVTTRYDLLIRNEIEHISLFTDSSYFTYTWKPDSGTWNGYTFFVETGAGFEKIINKKVSLFVDVCGTYQRFLHYGGDSNIGISYVEVSPGINYSLAKWLKVLAGVSVPYNPDMSRQLPVLGFLKFAAVFGDEG